MEVEIFSPDFRVNDSVQHLVERGLRNLLAWRWRELRRVRVTLSDFEAPSGPHKLCRLIVDLRDGDVIRVACSATTLNAAVGRASVSAERSVDDALRFKRAGRRRSLGVLF